MLFSKVPERLYLPHRIKIPYLMHFWSILCIMRPYYYFWHYSQIFSSENYCELSVFPFDSFLLLTRYPSLWYLKLGSKHTNVILLLHLFNYFHSQSPPNFLRSQWLIGRWDTAVSWQLQLLSWSLKLLPLSLLMVSFLLMWSGRNGLRQASLGSLTILPINMNMTGRYPLRLARAKLDADIPMSYT